MRLWRQSRWSAGGKLSETDLPQLFPACFCTPSKRLSSTSTQVPAEKYIAEEGWRIEGDSTCDQYRGSGHSGTQSDEASER